MISRYENLKDDQLLAVVTVPAWFSTEMGWAVDEAASAGGFHVLRTVTEPRGTVYACMFRIIIHINQDEVSLLYDKGGGTFDVPVVRERYGRIDVVANEGSISLGGEDIDVAFCEYIISRSSAMLPELVEI